MCNKCYIKYTKNVENIHYSWPSCDKKILYEYSFIGIICIDNLLNITRYKRGYPSLELNSRAIFCRTPFLDVLDQVY